MIPLGTINNPTRRMPYLTYGLILANILVFLWQLTQGDQLFQAFEAYAFMACEVGRVFLPELLLDTLRSAFLHADAFHLISNMVFLWIFGTNVEDYFGRRSFLSLYFLGTLAATLVHTILATDPSVCIPIIGASGAISAVLGAYILLFPGTRVRVGIPLLRIFMIPLTLPAFVVLGIWFALQLVSGVTTLGGPPTGGVAFWAHIGGFIFGLIFAFIYTLFNRAPDSVRDI